MLIYANYVDLWASKCSETVNDLLGEENHLGPCAIISCGKYNHSENAFKSLVKEHMSIKVYIFFYIIIEKKNIFT